MLHQSLIVYLLFEIRIQFVRVVTVVRFEFDIVRLINCHLTATEQQNSVCQFLEKN